MATWELQETIAPVDYEEFLVDNIEEANNEILRPLLLFSDDDIEVLNLKRECRTTTWPIPPKEDLRNDPLLYDSVRCYTADFTIVRRRYEPTADTKRDYSLPYSQAFLKSLMKQEYEIDVQENKLLELEDNSRSKKTSTHNNNTTLRINDGFSTFRTRLSSTNVELKGPNTDELLLSVLTRRSPEEEQQDAAQKRIRKRYNVLFANTSKSEGMIYREYPLPPVRNHGEKICVKSTTLRFKLDIEPIFALMALYDVKARKRISETFHFDMNNAKEKKMISNYVKRIDFSTLAQTAIFSISNPSPDIYLVVRSLLFVSISQIEKVLQQGDISEVTDLYVKEGDASKYLQSVNNIKQFNVIFKNRAKLEANAASNCERLGQYRMPFAWAAVNIVDILTAAALGNMDVTAADKEAFQQVDVSGYDGLKNNSPVKSPAELLEDFQSVSVKINHIYKQESDKLNDEDMYKFLADIKRQGSVTKKLKTIPGYLELELSKPDSEIKCCFTSTLHELKSFYSNPTTRPTKEIEEFPSKPILVPHTEYVNLLYVYPLSLNFSNRTGSARNIGIKLEIKSSSDDSAALPFIFGRSSCSEFTREAYTAITYHNKTPQYYEEFKIKFPAHVTPYHHLFFTFFHVSCQRKQDGQSEDVIPIGYAWIPLENVIRPLEYNRDSNEYLLNGVPQPVVMDDLKSREFNLPICVDKPNDKHCCRSPTELMSGRRYLDGGKPLFNFTTKIISSVHIQDIFMRRFFDACYAAENIIEDAPVFKGTNFENGLRRCVHGLTRADQEHLVKFLHLTLNKVLKIMVRPPIQDRRLVNIGPAAFDTVASIIHQVHQLLPNDCDFLGRNKLLLSYGYYIFNPYDLMGAEEHERVNVTVTDIPSGRRSSDMSDTVTFKWPMIAHEEIVLQWITSNATVRETAMRHAWFFFNLMIKSMHIYADRMQKTSRTNLFSSMFIDDLSRIVSIITQEIMNKFLKDPGYVSTLNESLGFFFNDAFSIMDRGVVFQLMDIYIRQINTVCLAEADLELRKFDLLRIVCSHEYFIALNLPLATPLFAPVLEIHNDDNSYHEDDYGSMAQLSVRFRQQHYLVGLLLVELAYVLQTGQQKLYSTAITILSTLLASLDNDKRYKSSLCRQRIASLFMPIMDIVVESIPQLYRSKTSDSNDKRPFQHRASLSFAGVPLMSSKDSETQRGKINYTNTRMLLTCFLWMVKNIDCQRLIEWLASRSSTYLISILDVLNICNELFGYQGEKCQQEIASSGSFHGDDVKSKLEDAILGSSSARFDMIMRNKGTGQQLTPNSAVDKSPPSSRHQSGLRWSKDTSYRQQQSTIAADRLKAEAVAAANENFVDVLNVIVKTVLKLLSRNHSATVLQNVFAIQRLIINKYPELLFEEDTDICADLCHRMLELSNSSLSTVRSHASVSLYILMRQSHTVNQNFSQIKAHLTMSLSTLFGHSESVNVDGIRKSLKNLLAYADYGKELQDTTFYEQIHELVYNLHTILSDTINMKVYEEDPQMLLDLMYRIAKGYRNSPDLRLAWLQYMAQKNEELNNFAEAAQCHVHSAALVCEYIHDVEDLPWLPSCCASFESISSNVLEESAILDDAVLRYQDGGGDTSGKHFSEQGVVNMLLNAAKLFQKAHLHECLDDVYKLLVPIFKAHQDYDRLTEIYGHLHESYSQAGQVAEKRIANAFFRVGFYGSCFGDLDGREYIYKEPPFTRLSEVSLRVQSLYNEKLGSGDIVEIVGDSNTVDREKLNPEKGYIQVTFVEPYFEEFELKSRRSHFQKNYNLRRFMFAIPFTQSGKAHGDLQHQYKRRVMLITSHAFPYLKSRISVVDREETVITPIEVAIQDMQRKTRELTAALYQNPLSPKLLQMLIQGSIGTTVHQGPLEIATVFLGGKQVQWDISCVTKLQLSFKEFTKRCEECVQKNKTLITPEQSDYQKEMERSLKEFKQRLKPLLAKSTAKLQRRAEKRT
ncbi:Dedicator of cytokinesis protein 6 [Trichoplax sp. H2]|nr:Dedicator of cytokinesis protein 6 [Trichoplax sp. H2]|eukprot:RDD36831.1 Dedicator of cytokinesis protein 6 [Trichoplax sp. H2]